jgi:phospholipase C
MQRPSTRRQFLGRSLAATGAAFLAACGVRTGQGDTPSMVPDVASGIDTRWPIKRVVYLMLENRSFNNLFANYPGATGTMVGVADGKEMILKRCPNWLPGDLPHDRPAGISSVNGGKMDGFRQADRSPAAAYFAYSAFQREDIPNYWSWADEYVLCDNFFSSMLGPSYPNHLGATVGDPLGVMDNPRGDWARFGTSKAWGCDSPDSITVPVLRSDGTEEEVRPCFDDVTTVPNQLTDADVPWAYYSPTADQVGYIWATLNSFPSIFKTDLWDEHMRPVDHLLNDIDAGNLPAVTWIVPRYQLSDHPPWSSVNAHNWTTQIVNAIMTSPMWESTAIFVTWDEWGGFYDPVPPPQVDDLGLGIRVPMLLISPYAQQGMIDHEVGEFASPLKFIQANWGLHHHTKRIRRTHDFSHAFDFSAPPRDPIPLDLLPSEGDPYRPPSEPDPSWPKRFTFIEDLGV